MRRRLIFLTLLLTFFGGIYLIFSGILFSPFLRSFEQSFGDLTACKLTIGQARLTLTGHFLLNDITLQKEGTQGAHISEIRINPRWTALLTGKILADRVQIKMAEGELDLDGVASISSRTFDLNIKTLGFPLDQIARAFFSIPDSLHVRHTGEGKVVGNTNQWELDSKGRLDHQGPKMSSNPQLNFRVQFSDDKGDIETHLLDEKFEADIKIKCDKSREWEDGQFVVKTSNVAAFANFWPDIKGIQGSLTAQGHLKGSWHSPQAVFQASGQGFRYGEVRVENWQAYFEHKENSPNPFLFEVSGSTVAWVSKTGRHQNFPHMKLVWGGDLNEGDLQMQIQLQNRTVIKGKGQAHRSNKDLAWRWATLSYLTSDGQEWTAVPGGLVQFKSDGGIDVQKLRFELEESNLNIKRFSFGNDQIYLDVAADNFIYNQTLNFFGMATPIHGLANGEVHLKGPLENPRGDFKIQISCGSAGNLPLEMVHANGTVSDSQLRLQEMKIGGTNIPPLTLHGTIPWSWFIYTPSNQSMDMVIVVQTFDPAVLLEKIPEAQTKPGGTFQFSAQVKGQRQALSLQGTLTAILPLLQIPSLGLDARDATLDVELKNQHLLIRRAEVKLGKGNLQVTGESDLPALQFNVRGDNVSLKIRRQLDATGDIQLELSGSTTAPLLTGDIHLDEATYEVRKKKKDEDKKEINSILMSAWERFQIAVKSKWENNVWFRDGLTKIETQANLEMQKDHGQRDLRIDGEVDLVRGSYDAYGRDFVIKSGNVTFAGATPMDAQLNILATHTMPDAVVELNVSGTAEKPELHFLSTPPMPEQDILAMLALGKAPGQFTSQSNEADKNVPAGADLAADMVSDYLTRELRSAGMNVLDLDVIRVSPSEKGKEWTVGRYLGPDLFLSFSYNPDNSASQVLKAEYTLFPRWTLVGQSGSQTDNYLDLNFRIPVGKPR